MHAWRLFLKRCRANKTVLCISAVLFIWILSYYRHSASNGQLVQVDRKVPLLWVGGVPRSGTTLLRAMLDTHPSVRCGAETRVVPRLLGMHRNMQQSRVENARLHAAGMTTEVLDSALAAYLLSIVSSHAPSIPRPCNKDPFSLRFVKDLLRLFPSSQFIFIVRDGRAVAHSMIERKVRIKGFNTDSYEGAMAAWNKAVASMYMSCLRVGPSICHIVRYEELVLQPRIVMQGLLRFLRLPWYEGVLHHEKEVGQRIQLSVKELSTDQVSEAVNNKALMKWMGHIPEGLQRTMATVAPMLEILGYDPESANPPRYDRQPDIRIAPSPEQMRVIEQINKQSSNHSITT